MYVRCAVSVTCKILSMLLSFWLEQGRTGREQKKRGWSHCRKKRLWKFIRLLHAVGITLEAFHN